MTKALFVIGCYIALWPVAALWRANVVIILWGWFIKPGFGWDAPSLYFAAGAMLLLSIAIPNHIPPGHNKGPAERFGEVLSHTLGMPLVALGFGSLWRWLQWGIT